MWLPPSIQGTDLEDAVMVLKIVYPPSPIHTPTTAATPHFPPPPSTHTFFSHTMHPHAYNCSNPALPPPSTHTHTHTFFSHTNHPIPCRLFWMQQMPRA